MRIKVCGLRYPDNIARIAALDVQMMGFIFYPPSPRYAAGLDARVLTALPPRIRRVGVFVDEDAQRLLSTVRTYGLDTVQLHGGESPGYCQDLRDKGLSVIKALGIAQKEDLRRTSAYRDACDRLLFDTRSPAHGGTGRHFDWDLLAGYRGPTPFLLSGGIRPEDARALAALDHPYLEGVDLNSGFETAPGVKDQQALADFIRRLRG